MNPNTAQIGDLMVSVPHRGAYINIFKSEGKGEIIPNQKKLGQCGKCKFQKKEKKEKLF